jgi:hypothetical protein
VLNSRPIADQIVAALQSIPELVAAMGGNAENIFAYHYLFSEENRLESAISQLTAPSIMVAWKGTMPGARDGQTLWAHHFYVFIRTGRAVGLAVPLSYEDIWWLMINGKVFGSAYASILDYNLVAGLEIMDIPSALHQLDESRFDFFQSVFCFPEIGNN